MCLDQDNPQSMDKWFIHLTHNTCTTFFTLSIFKPLWSIGDNAIAEQILFLPCQTTWFNIFWIISIWFGFTATQFKIWVNIEKTKTLETNTQASSVRWCIDHLETIAHAFLSGTSKLSFIRSPNPRNTPKYFTGVKPIVIPAQVNLCCACGSKAMVFSRFRCRPVK